LAVGTLRRAHFGAIHDDAEANHDAESSTKPKDPTGLTPVAILY
jgi:hypothetical protein